MRRAVVYARVSTDAQERDGTSLDTQERGCAELATSHGWSLVRCIRDAASGFDLDREGIETLRGMLRRGEVDVVIAYAVDRLSRNQNHIGVLFDEVEQAGARLEFVTERFEDTAVGRFILAARAFVAEVEREKIAERTMRGKAERARSGRLPQGTGRGLYGYRYDSESGTREIVPEQARVVRRIFEDFAAGGSCHGITETLNREGIPAFSGGRWHALTARRILLNEAYAGRTVYRRTRVEKVRDPVRGRWVRRVTERDEEEWIEIEGVTPAIVPRALFDRAQARLNDPQRRNRTRPSMEYPLRGRLRCRACGAPMVGQSLQRGRYRYYRCRRSYAGPRDDRCSSKYVRKEALEASVRESLRDVLAEPDRVIAEVRRASEQRVDAEALARFEAEISDVEAQQRRLVKLFTTGALPEALLTEESRQLSERRDRLESERAALARHAPAWDAEDLAKRLPEVLDRVREWIGDAECDNFDLLLRAVDAQISVSENEVVIRGAVPLIEPEAQPDLVTIEQTSA